MSKIPTRFPEGLTAMLKGEILAYMILGVISLGIYLLTLIF